MGFPLGDAGLREAAWPPRGVLPTLSGTPTPAQTGVRGRPEGVSLLFTHSGHNAKPMSLCSYLLFPCILKYFYEQQDASLGQLTHFADRQ